MLALFSFIHLALFSNVLDVASLFDFAAGLVAFLFVIVVVLIFIFVYDNLRKERKPATATA
ncbi:MAG: hypothetical protein JRN20_23080 [Nitrososphaerota archaeon]|nr:hypothetical protein [Nitrososphaerota archaeon]